MISTPNILIAGLGNLLRSDDGVGPHVIRALQQAPPDGAVLLDGGTAVLDLLPWVEQAGRVLVIDAMEGGHPPGTIYIQALEETVPRHRTSLHALGLRETWRCLAPGAVLPEITVIGVEPACLDYGLELSAAVRQAVPAVVERVREWVAESQAALFRPDTGRTFGPAVREAVSF